jgi:hypothetical protein
MRSSTRTPASRLASRLASGLARRLAVGLALVLLAAPPLASVSSAAAAGSDSYLGFDLELLGEATARLTTLRTQHGEPRGNAEFASWLASKGLARADYDRAWNLWWERFRADPSGQLEARFHRINSEWAQQLNFADAPDHRQEQREGVTLDTYARIAVALTRLPGAKLEDVLRQHGVRDAAHWQRVNEAWAKAMKEDTSFALVQQYGALYQKYAGPQFAAEQEAVVANAMAEHNRRLAEAPPPRARPAEPETLDQVVARMTAAEDRDRWEAAREYAHACDLWMGPARQDPKDPRAARCTTAALQRDLAPVLLEALDRADDRTIGFAVRLADYFRELGIADDRAELTLQRTLNRARERLATLEASFAPIADKAVPERMLLRPKIDEYTAAVRDLEALLAAW